MSHLLATVPELRTRRLPTGDSALDRVLFGGFPVGECVLVSGPPGSGKSRLTLRWGSRWECLLVATEMPEGQIRELAPGAGVDPSRVHILDRLPSPSDLALEVGATGAQAVIVDSVSGCERPRPEIIIKSLIGVARQTGVPVFAIVHETAKGRPHVRRSGEHDPGLTLRVTPAGRGFALVTLRKNRFAPGGSARVALGPPELRRTRK